MERVIRSREDLFNTLHMLRINSGMHQHDVADALGVVQQAVSQWEGAGHAHLPRIEMLARLLDFYGYEFVIRERKHETHETHESRIASDAAGSE